MEVIRNQEFILLPAEEVSRLLASDDLNVPSEEVIFHAFMSWVKHDLPNRKKDISKLLSLVKMPLLSPQVNNYDRNVWLFPVTDWSCQK